MKEIVRDVSCSLEPGWIKVIRCKVIVLLHVCRRVDVERDIFLFRSDQHRAMLERPSEGLRRMIPPSHLK